nr:protein FAR1-related sequence 5-like [Tanacetum cinerariifolium]
MCDRGGKPRGSSTNTSSKKTNCPFKVVAKYSLEHHYWTIRVVCIQHNHRPTMNLEGHAYARRLSKEEFRLVEDLTSRIVPPREILSTFNSQLDSSTCGNIVLSSTCFLLWPGPHESESTEPRVVARVRRTIVVARVGSVDSDSCGPDQSGKHVELSTTFPTMDIDTTGLL